MEFEKDSDLRLVQLSLIAKIIASFTHEVKNHLAFIKESAGLVGDIMESRKSLTKQDVQQSLNVLQSVKDQIGKTSDLCNYLNRFAHRMDKPFSTFGVNETLEELLVLLHKLSSQKRIILERDFDKNLPAIHSDPAKLQFLIFCIIEEKLRRLDNNSRIIVKSARSSGSITIEVIPRGNSVETVEEGICPHEICQYLIKQLGGSISQEAEEIVVTLPVAGSPLHNVP